MGTITELEDLRDLLARMEFGGVTVRLAGEDITVKERTRLEARVLHLEAVLHRSCQNRSLSGRR
jgi:hypothetical protein